MKRLFDNNLYEFGLPQSSYWEATVGDIALDDAPLDTNDCCDVAIIGGGYTGLSAAYHLARDYDVDVRVLEAGHFGWGASGRNGGFCCIGGTGLHRDGLVKRAGLEAARDYYRAQVDAVELVRQIGSDESIDFQPQGQGEVEVAHTPRAFERLQKDHALMTEGLGLDAELYSPDEARERFYDSTEQFGALISKPAFGLHPLRYCRGLAAAASARGARLHRHSEVVNWVTDAEGNQHVYTREGQLQARRVIYATNGFIQEKLRPEFFARTIPVISAIIVTRPLTDDELAAQQWVTEHPVANSRRILNYYRILPDKRLLFGGRGDARGSEDGERRTYAGLAETLGSIWPHWKDIDIEYRWHGLICTTATLCPTIGQLDDDANIYFGFGYHGNGVNTATWAGKQLADWIGKGREPDGLPAVVRGLGGEIPAAGPAYELSWGGDFPVPTARPIRLIRTCRQRRATPPARP